MSFKDDLLKQIDPGKVVTINNGSKKKKKEQDTVAATSGKSNASNELLQHLDVAPVRMSSLGSYSSVTADDDIAPVKDTGKLDFFQKGAFDNGVNLKTISQAILGTAGDVGVGAFKGLGNLAEGIGDFISYRAADVIEATGNESKADGIRRRAQKNIFGDMLQGTDEYLDQYSVLGRTSDSLVEGLGLIGGIAATGGLGAAAGLGTVGTTILTSSAMGLSSAGSAQGEAYMGGATDEEARTYAMIAGASDALSEMLFAGLGKPLKALGVGAGLSSADDILAKKVSGLFTNQIAKNMAQFGVKASAEGMEEIIAGVSQAIGKKLTYMSEEEMGDILRDENLLEQFVVGAATSGLLQSGIIPGTSEGSVIEANRKGSDFITGLSKNEMTVIDKVVQDEIAAKEKDGKKLTNKEKNAVREDVIRKMERGEISTDTIEELFGGDTYKTYQDAVAEEETAIKELSELYKDDELKQQIETFKQNSKLPGIRQQLSEEVSKYVSGDRLIESYFERGRGSQKFEADITKYDEKQRAVIQSAIDSGILNNKRRTHEMVDLIAKISADKGVPFDFTNNEQIANSSFAVEGATVDGYVTEDGHITLNVESPKYLNTTVGHEITHVLEGTELYETLQNTLFEYAKGRKAKDSKFDNEYMERLYNARNLYKNVKGYQGVDGFNKVKNEVAADLVGEYLFTDDAFIRKLSVENRNIFEKIYDEIKYLCKIVTAGSKEARELERVKKAFEDAYRGDGKKTAEAGETSVSAKTEGGGALDDVFAMKHVNNTTADMIINSAELTQAFKDITGITLTGTTVDKRKMIRDAVRMRQQLKAQSDAAAVKASEKANAEYATEQEAKAAELAAKTAQAVAENELDVLRTSGYASYIRGIFKNGATVADAREILSNPGMRAAWENVTNKTLPANEKSAIKMIMETKRNPDNIELPKYSLSDSDGKQLTKEQQTYFKDSKVRDENGALKVMYHGSQDAGFHVFDAGMSDDGRSFFFVDRNEVAASYSGTSETYAPRVFQNAEDANNFFKEMGFYGGKYGYEVVESNGKYTLLSGDDEIATSDDLAEIYEEFCDYEGVGYGDANYKVYLNLRDPLVVDAAGKNWNELRNWAKAAYTKAENVEVRRVDDEFRLFDKNTGTEIPNSSIAANSYTEKMEHTALLPIMVDKANNSLSINTENLTTTRDISGWAKKHGYDGVIFNNIHDNGGYSNGSEGASTVAIAFDSNQIKSVANTKPTADADIRYSLSEAKADNDYFDAVIRGDTETAQKMLDDAAKAAGYTIKAYHGTRSDEFFIFDKNRIGDNYGGYNAAGGAFDFSTDKFWAARWGMKASGKGNVRTIPVYLKAEKTFYSYQDVPKDLESTLPKGLTEAEKEEAMYSGYAYKEVLEKHGIDFKKTIMSKGYDSYSQYPGHENIAVYDPEQIKSAELLTDNPETGEIIPLSERFNAKNPDIRFSLSEEVEKTDRFVAVHNKSTRGVMRMLEREGVPFASIAIKRAGTPHEGFGECSIVFPRSTIDPEDSKWNKLYSNDAWTPTEPRTEYDVGDTYEYQKRFENMVGSDIYHALKGSSYLSSDHIERELGSNNGNIFNAVKRLGVVKYGYLQSIGQRPVAGTKPKTLDGFGRYKNDQLLAVFEAVDGETLLNAGYDDTDVKQKIADVLNEQFMQQLPNEESVFKSFKRKPVYSADKINIGIIRDAYRKWEDAGRTIPEEIDFYSLEKTLRDNSALEEDADYQRWVEGVFDGLIKDSGIPNGKDFYTPSGNRRSFKQLHVPATLDNIVQQMRKENETGVGALGTINLRGAATKTYNTVEDMRQDIDKLLGTHIDDDVYKGYMRGFYDRLSDLVGRAAKGDGWSQREAAEETLLEAVRDAKTKAAMNTKLRKEAQWIHYNQSLVDDLWQLKQDVQNMPAPYFEAKPRRVVTPDEAAAYIIPDNAPAKLISELGKRGLPYKIYKAGDEADRLAKLNSILDEQPDLRFSLSNPNETPTTFGNYHVSGKDVMYTPEDIAPVRADGVITDNAKATTNNVGKAPVKSNISPEKDGAKVLTEMPKSKKKFKLLNWAEEHLLDNGMVFEKLAKKTKNRKLEADWNFIRNAESAAQHLIGNGKGDAPALKKLMDTVNKSGKTEKFYEYLLHMHNVDRMSLAQRFPGSVDKAVFGDGVTADISQVKADKLVKENPEFASWAQDVYAFNEHLRGMLVENGVITQETADLWAEMYPHYVPIYRVGKDGKIVSDPNSKHTGVNAPLKKATGGNQPIEPLFDAMARRTIQTYKAIAKNNFGIELMNTLGSVVDSADGNAAEDADNFARDLDMVDLLAKGEEGGNPTFTVFENGKRVTFEITNEMYEAMKPKSEILAQKVPGLYHVSSIFRGLTTQYNPVFALTNPIKDIQDVLMNSQHPGKTYGNIPRAIAQMASNGQYYQEYLENGGHNNTYFDTETKTFTEESKAKQLLDKVFAINDYIEMTPRLAEYIASREAGRSIEESMLDAARVTTNFAAGGDVTKFANRNGVTFLNASVQGAIQQVRNIGEAHQKGLMGYLGLAAKIAVAGLPSILLNNMLWDDDEEYEELADYVKQNYYIVGKYDDGRFIRIPKGRTLAVIQNAFEQVQHVLTGDGEADFGEFMKLAAENLAPNNPFDNNIFAPIKQIRENKTWYGEDLIPSRLQDLPAAEQFDEKTDSLSRWIGEKTNTSPYKWNYALNQYSGGIGDFFLPMMTPKAESGTDSFMSYFSAPFVDKFTTDSVLNNQVVTDFYDKQDELRTIANSKDATEEDLFKEMYMTSVGFDTSDLYKQKREVQSSDLPDSEKYEKVREIQEQINELMEEAMSSYNHPKIDGLYAEVGSRRYDFNEENGQWYEITPKNYKGEDNYFYEQEQKVTKGLGISYSQYWNNKAEYDFAYDYPEKYALAKAVGGYNSYVKYYGDNPSKPWFGEMSGIRSDYDENGDYIPGTKKDKVIDYLNELDADYGEKIILFKSMYNGDDSYNNDIIDYLNSRDDISYQEMETILKELGFEVDSKGNISW